MDKTDSSLDRAIEALSKAKDFVVVIHYVDDKSDKTHYRMVNSSFDSLFSLMAFANAITNEQMKGLVNGDDEENM